MDFIKYFSEPASKRQKQYEAIRAFFVDKLSAEEVANKFGYKTSSIYTFIRDVNAGKLDLFPEVVKGPKQRMTPETHQQQILELRKQNYSIHDIYDKLLEIDIKVSVKTIERIIKDNGYESYHGGVN